MSFKPTPSDLFFTKNDPRDPRLGELVKVTDQIPDIKADERAFAIIGYPDDEGININGGRLGAADAPNVIRKFLFKMTPAADSNAVAPKLFDLGNLDIEKSGAIESRHTLAQEKGAAVFASGARLLSFGGGHDYGFPDTAAFAEYCRDNGHRPLVINFDAHLDVRPTDKGPSSGTPFFRLLEAFPEMDFAEVGIQAHCNAKAHLDWAKSKGARLISFDDWMMSGESLVAFVSRKLEDWLLKPRPVFLSIDIDGFSSAYAVGCSQSWATGFRPDDFMRLLQLLSARLDVRGAGIYEVSPPLDQDDQTAKLAALLAHRILYPL